jgi:hypothetical protein
MINYYGRLRGVVAVFACMTVMSVAGCTASDPASSNGVKAEITQCVYAPYETLDWTNPLVTGEVLLINNSDSVRQVAMTVEILDDSGKILGTVGTSAGSLPLNPKTFQRETFSILPPEQFRDWALTRSKTPQCIVKSVDVK